jgi:ribosomal protein S18 acetylase RimI-like enzyme
MELEFSKAKLRDLDQILILYKEVIKKTFTTWDENYPSKELIINDIKSQKLYIVKMGGEIIAVSYMGVSENTTEKWSIELKNPLGVARICVNPKFQGMGVGTRFMNFLVEEAKKQGADGMHFHVCTQNVSAEKMYKKSGFKNYGLGESNYGFDYYRFEQKF